MDHSQDRMRPLESRATRYAAGKALRRVVSREDQSRFSPDPARDPLPILAAGDPIRVQALVPERYRRMAASPFAFYRGAAALMAHDLAALPSLGLPVQASGDCHLMNFGAFLTPERRVLFDINDFDETYPGVDFTADLKRLAGSVAVAAQAAGLADTKAQAMAEATVCAYRTFLLDLAARSPLEIWQVAVNLADELAALDNAALETKVLAKLVRAEKGARPADDFPDIRSSKDGTMAIGDRPPWIYHVGSDGEPVDRVLNQTSLSDYAATLLPDRRQLLDRYGLRDVAFKVVGVGSVGTYCAVGLLASADNEALILQLKQAWTSSVAPLSTRGTFYANQGQRVVEGQRMMQAASDPFLGWTQDEDGRHFYLRQLKNRRLGSIGELMEGKALPAYATLCGRTLARAHARTGDPARIAGYMGKTNVFDAAVAQFAISYASQTASDHAKLRASALVPSKG